MDCNDGCAETTLCPDSFSILENNEPKSLQLHNNYIQNTLNEIFSSVGVEEFAKEFKDHSIFQKHPHTIKSLHRLFGKAVNDEINELIKGHIIEDELKEKFTQLEQFIQSSSPDAPVWRPSQGVEENIRPYIMREKINMRDQLKLLVLKKEAAVDKLRDDVTKNRNKEKDIKKRLDHLFAKLQYISEEMRSLSI